MLVSGTRLGTLRYLDVTDFAGGLWAGVELDDPVGKNDGCVAGTRLSDRTFLFAVIACCFDNTVSLLEKKLSAITYVLET